jgi:hypothetical protein
MRLLRPSAVRPAIVAGAAPISLDGGQMRSSPDRLRLCQTIDETGDGDSSGTNPTGHRLKAVRQRIGAAHGVSTQ